MRATAAAILFAILLAFIAALCFYAFQKLFISFDAVITGIAAAAFLGAFFAFLFVRIGDFLRAYYDRSEKGYSTLVKLEFRLNSLLGRLDDNVYLIETFEKIYSQYEKQQGTHNIFLWANRLQPVGQLDDLIPGLTNIDFLNDLFRFDVHLRKLNESMETVNGAYVESKDALLRKDIDPNNYMTNVNFIRGTLLDIRKFLDGSISECMDTLAAVRVLTKNRPLISALMRKLPGYKYGPKFVSERDSEKSKLKEEMKSIKKTGQERINKILQKTNGG